MLTQAAENWVPKTEATHRQVQHAGEHCPGGSPKTQRLRSHPMTTTLEGGQSNRLAHYGDHEQTWAKGAAQLCSAEG